MDGTSNSLNFRQQQTSQQERNLCSVPNSLPNSYNLAVISPPSPPVSHMYTFPALPPESLSLSLPLCICPACLYRLQRLRYSFFLKGELTQPWARCSLAPLGPGSKHMATKKQGPACIFWEKLSPRPQKKTPVNPGINANTWSAVEIAEHLGAGHRDGFPNICRAPACDVVPDTAAG